MFTFLNIVLTVQVENVFSVVKVISLLCVCAHLMVFFLFVVFISFDLGPSDDFELETTYLFFLPLMQQN